MFKIYQRLIAFFKRPIVAYPSNNYIETYSHTSVREKNTKAETVENTFEDSIESTLGFLKNKNNEIIQSSKNTDYERNLFLYELGFTKLKRVREFIGTMNQVGNIEEFNIVEKKYSKYNLEILNDEMLNIIKKEYGFIQELNDKFDDFIPNVAIDTLKTNYTTLDSNRLVYNLYDRYYMNDSAILVAPEQAESFMKNYYSSLKAALAATQKDKKEVYSSSHYYSLKRKNIHVCHNNGKGIILLEIEPKYYLILCDWTDKDGNTMDKMNFKEFIKNEI